MAPALRTQPESLVRRELLSQAPEFAALRILETALEVSVQALMTEHPMLEEANADPGEPKSVQRARGVLASVTSLQRAMRRYRAAVVVAITPARHDNDALPF